MRLELLDDRARHRAFQPCAVGLQRAADLRIDQPAADIGADRDRPGQVEHLDPRQPPQRIGRPGVAQLDQHRRIHQLGDDRPTAQRRKARLRPADGLAVADRNRPHRCMAAAKHGIEPDVDRLGRQHQPRPAEATDAQVGVARRLAVPAIIDAAAGNPAQPRLGPDDVEQLQRHRFDVGVELRPVAGPPGKRAAPAAKAHPRRRNFPAARDAGEDRRAVEGQRALGQFAASGDADPVRADLRHRDQLEGGAARAGQRRPDFARSVDQPGIGGQPRQRNAAGRQSARRDNPVERRPAFGQDDRFHRPGRTGR